MFIIFFMIEQILLSPQVKQSVIISNKPVHDYLTNITKCQENLKTLQNYCVVLSSAPKINVLSVLVKIISKTKMTFSCSTLFHMKTRVYLKFLSMIVAELERRFTTLSMEMMEWYYQRQQILYSVVATINVSH